MENVSVWTNFHKDGGVCDEAHSPKKTPVCCNKPWCAITAGKWHKWMWNFPILYTLSEKTKFTCSKSCSAHSLQNLTQEFRQKPIKFQLIIKPHRRGEAPIFFLPEFPILSDLFVWDFGFLLVSFIFSPPGRMNGVRLDMNKVVSKSWVIKELLHSCNNVRIKDYSNIFVNHQVNVIIIYTGTQCIYLNILLVIPKHGEHVGTAVRSQQSRQKKSHPNSSLSPKHGAEPIPNDAPGVSFENSVSRTRTGNM